MTVRSYDIIVVVLLLLCFFM